MNIHHWVLNCSALTMIEGNGR